MDDDLDETFHGLSEHLLVGAANDERFIFHQDILPVLPARLKADTLFIWKGRSYYGYGDSFMVDHLLFHAPQRTYRALGFLILTVVLHPDVRAVQVVLNHPESTIKTLVVEYASPHLDDLSLGLTQQPYAFVYDFGDIHPLQDRCPDPAELPCFWLTNAAAFALTDAERQQRDRVVGFGSGAGSVVLAELLLNASLPTTTRMDFSLRWMPRAVGDFSAEATFFTLPE